MMDARALAMAMLLGVALVTTIIVAASYNRRG